MVCSEVSNVVGNGLSMQHEVQGQNALRQGEELGH